MPIKLACLAIAIVSFVILPSADAGYGAGDARLEKLYGKFIAPCCWRESLFTHDSPEAAALREQILGMVREGRSDGEIESALLGEYGKRILVVPKGAEGAWLFWTPGVAALLGLAAIVLMLRRRPRKTAPLLAGSVPAELEEGWDRD